MHIIWFGLPRQTRAKWPTWVSARTMSHKDSKPRPLGHDIGSLEPIQNCQTDHHGSRHNKHQQSPNRLTKSTKNQTIRTKGPLRLPNESKYSHTETIGSRPSSNELNSKPNATQHQKSSTKSRQKPKPKIPNVIFITKSSFPTCFNQNPTRKISYTHGLGTNRDTRVETRGHSPSKSSKNMFLQKPNKKI